MELTHYNRGLLVDVCLWLGEAYDSAGITVEGSRPTNHYGVSFTVGGEEHDLSLHVGLPVIGSWYVSFRDFLPRRFRSWMYKRAQKKAAAICEGAGYEKIYAYQCNWFGLGLQTGVTLYEDHLSVRFFSDCDRLHGGYWSVFLKDVFLGREVYKTKTLATFKETIRMPEGNYPAFVSVSRVERSRFMMGTKLSWRFSVEVTDGVPMPGKGENSWDCGEDAAYSISFPEVPITIGADFVLMAADYARKFAESVMETRLQYGGSDWKPEAKTERTSMGEPPEDQQPAKRPM